MLCKWVAKVLKFQEKALNENMRLLQTIIIPVGSRGGSLIVRFESGSSRSSNSRMAFAII